MTQIVPEHPEILHVLFQPANVLLKVFLRLGQNKTKMASIVVKCNFQLIHYAMSKLIFHGHFSWCLGREFAASNIHEINKSVGRCIIHVQIPDNNGCGGGSLAGIGRKIVHHHSRRAVERVNILI